MRASFLRVRHFRHSIRAVCAPLTDSRDGLEGSADNTIKLWKQHKNVRTYPGHTQAVRGLALITDIGFASCSNDRCVLLPVCGSQDAV